MTMTSDRHARTNLIEAWLAANNGQATAEQARLLNESIAADPAARDLVVALAEQQAWLIWHGSADVPADDGRHAASDNCNRAASVAAPPLPLGDGHELSPLTGAIDLSSDGVGSQGIGGSLPTWGLAFGLFLTSLAVAFSIWFAASNRGGQQLAEAPADDRGSAVARPPVVELGAVTVQSGTVRMVLPNVGDMLVEGPAQFVLVSPKRLQLDQGRIKIRVTDKRGRGFAVVTPHGEIVDLGTEFGVEVSDAKSSELLVFDGEVDLHLADGNQERSVTRLRRGEGAQFDGQGQLGRIMSVSTGNVATFLLPSRESHAPAAADSYLPVIQNVRDDIRGEQTRSFYEIVHGGFHDGVQSFVDRTYVWRGAGGEEIPDFLQGADYVKTFNDDKVVKLRLTLELAQAADLYLFWDNRVRPTNWLKRDFVDSGRRLDLVEIGKRDVIERGAPVPVRTCSIWHRRVDRAGSVELGSIEMRDAHSSMYAIAAQPLSDPPMAGVPMAFVAPKAVSPMAVAPKQVQPAERGFHSAKLPPHTQ